MMISRLRTQLCRFVTDDSGTLAVSRMFMVTAALAVGLTVAGIFAFGGDTASSAAPAPQVDIEAAFRAANGGRDRVTALAEGPRDYYTSDEIRQRFNIYNNPNQTSDEEARAAHRTWARRVADPAYSQPGRARDMVMILEQVLEARGLTAHRRM